MPLNHKRLDAIEESDLYTLVANRDGEAKTIEYKEKLPNFNIAPPGRNAVLTEFLADVSSFANGMGGDLLYGVKAVKGVPVEVIGLQLTDEDGTKLQLEELIRSHIRPRFPFDIQLVTLKDASKGVVLILRVDRGFAPPHQITFDRDYRFYSRNSAGKYRLDVDELRNIFELSATTARRMRDFRAERLADIISGQTPVPLTDQPKLVLHVVPYTSFDASMTYDVVSLTRPYDQNYLQPLASPSNVLPRLNFDGVLTSETSGEEGLYDGYVQLFRNGIIEAVDSYILVPERRPHDLTGRKYLSADQYEDALLEALPTYLSTQEKLGIALPIFVMVSLLGVADRWVAFTARRALNYGQVAIDKDNLLVPEVRLDTFNPDPAQVLKPVFDAVANAGGWYQSMNYNKEGERIQEQS